MSATNADEEVRHAYELGDLQLSQETQATLWQLFEAIGKFWDTVTDTSPMKSRWLTFLANRIETDPSYAFEYRSGAALIRAMIEADGADATFERIFTDPQAAVSPPGTRLARLRQKVSNEFVDLHLSLGGFRAFGAKNYLGYIGGANIDGLIPYRKSEQ